MSKLILLYLTFIVAVLFVLVPSNNIVVKFPLSDMTVSLEYYIYSIFERSILIVLCYIIASEATEYRSAIWIFFCLVVVDLVDFLLCYNSVWFYLGIVPVSMNIVKSFVFGGVILNEAWKKYT